MELDDIRNILPLFLRHSNAAVAIKDLDGSYLFGNSAFERFAGAAPGGVVGACDADLLSPERARRAAEAEREILTSGRAVSESETFVSRGETICFQVARFPIFGEHERHVAIGVIAVECLPRTDNVVDAERALKQAQEANAQLRSAIFTLEELASTDRLTNAWNRRRFEETIEGETHRSARYGHPLSMLLIDVDHFKRVNDEFGHREGDRVLVAISSLIRAIMRKSDSLTRWGGEEFIVLMPNTGLGRAQATARRICETIAESEIDGIGRLTVSVGVAYGSDTELVRKILLQVAEAHPKSLKKPAPFVRFMNFGDSSLDFELFFWSREFLKIEDVRSDMRFEIDRLFRENNVTIPFPQRDVWMR